MLPEMHELAIEIDPDLSAHVAPAPAEGEVLGEVAPGIRIDHAVEEAPVQVRLRIAGRAIWHVIELGILLHHRQETRDA